MRIDTSKLTGRPCKCPCGLAISYSQASAHGVCVACEMYPTEMYPTSAYPAELDPRVLAQVGEGVASLAMVRQALRKFHGQGPSLTAEDQEVLRYAYARL